jgi:hypothetical protein
VVSLFCRHNRFVADCSICSKGTVLDQGRSSGRRASPSRSRSTRAAEKTAARSFAGPHVAGPARHGEDGGLTVVRLERVPGGVRLGEWQGSALAKRAPVLAAGELVELVSRAGEALQARDAAKLAAALETEQDPNASGDYGISRGRSGDFKEELRVEALDDGRVRVARWVLRPVAGWELQDAPPMLPAARYAEALTDAIRRGAVAPLSAETSANSPS